MPDFRRPGVLLRLLVVAEGARWVWWAIGAAAAERPPPLWDGGVLFEPVVLTVAALLAVLAPWWRRGPARRALVATAVLTVGVALAWRAWVERWGVAVPGPVSVGLGAVAVWALVAVYFDWRQLRLSPALAEARLLALQSRMRPHFLFNSLNGVLALMRRDPARAEAMLEDLAELYRALLAEPHTPVPWYEELALARAYLAVEQVRLGERLQCVWHVDTVPAQVLLPPLTLQPLVENAVRHGIEPRPDGGTITIEAFRDDDRLVLFVRNPLPPANAATRGHGLALANLRERLALLYDDEARLRVYESDGEFVVQVRLPLRPGVLSGALRRSAS